MKKFNRNTQKTKNLTFTQEYRDFISPSTNLQMQDLHFCITSKNILIFYLTIQNFGKLCGGLKILLIQNCNVKQRSRTWQNNFLFIIRFDIKYNWISRALKFYVCNISSLKRATFYLKKFYFKKILISLSFFESPYFTEN